MNTTRLKLQAFVISGAIAGFAGGVYVLTQNGLNTDSYDSAISIKLFSMVVIGGLGSLPGAVLGAVYVRSAEFFLPPAYSLLASGLRHPAAADLPPRGARRPRVPGPRHRSSAGWPPARHPRAVAPGRQAPGRGRAGRDRHRPRRPVGHQPVSIDEVKEVEHELLAGALSRMSVANEGDVDIDELEALEEPGAPAEAEPARSPNPHPNADAGGERRGTNGGQEGRRRPEVTTTGAKK